MFKEHGTKIIGAVGGVLAGVAMYLTPEQVASIVGVKGPAAMMMVASVLTFLRGFQNSGTLPGGPQK